ncbi:MAG TPA: glycerophosphodiester phosphodiesterase [Acidimicrobiales bacterium]|nr:glycerophosphodiester phosphodiesterase [Acidimicrobiales bacterium]
MSNRRNPLIIAHRGAARPGTHPENTVAAFRRARAVAADWVELDVRRTADAETAVHHDPHLADGRPVVSLRRDEVPFEVPDLGAALAACLGLGVNVEIKNFATEPDFDPTHWLAQAVVDATRRADPPISVLVSSFNIDAIDRVHLLAPSLPTALLTFGLDDPETAIARCVARGHRALHPFDATVDRALVEDAHAAGLAVNVWTVDRPDRISALAEMGVDGICTNVPDIARHVLESR